MAVAALAGCLLSGCGLGAAPTSDDPSSAASPWTPMPPAPLSARGFSATAWTGERLLVLGGEHVDEQHPPCPPAASCAAPPSTSFGDGAAWDPDARAWTPLRPTAATPLLPSDPAVWSGTALLTRSASVQVDLTAGTLTTAPLELGPALVYADPVWTGSALVGVGWDYGGTASGVDGQVVAEVLDLATGARTATAWPYEPPRTERAVTVWTGREVVALVSTSPASGGSSYRVAAFDPAARTWRALPLDGVGERFQPVSVTWDGAQVLVTTTGGDLYGVDPATGATTRLAALPDDPEGFVYGAELAVSPAGRVLLLGADGSGWLLQRGSDGRVRTGAAAWRRLPTLPTQERTTGRTVALAGEQLVVWGGSRGGEQGDGTVDSTQAWTLDLLHA